MEIKIRAQICRGKALIERTEDRKGPNLGSRSRHSDIEFRLAHLTEESGYCLSQIGCRAVGLLITISVLVS